MFRQVWHTKFPASQLGRHIDGSSALDFNTDCLGVKALKISTLVGVPPELRCYGLDFISSIKFTNYFISLFSGLASQVERTLEAATAREERGTGLRKRSKEEKKTHEKKKQA